MESESSNKPRRAIPSEAISNYQRIVEAVKEQNRRIEESERLEAC